MGLTEEITTLNTKIQSLTRKQEEAAKTLAITEHQLAEIEKSLSEAGIEVAGLSPEDLEALIEKMSADITTELARINAAIEQAEKQFEKFQNLK